MDNQYNPTWQERHTKIIEEYEKEKKEGNIKEFVVIPKDTD